MDDDDMEFIKDGRKLLFVCRLFTAGGIRSSLLSLMEDIKDKYDVSLVILSEDTSDDDMNYFKDQQINIIESGLLNKLIYTPGEYYMRNRIFHKLFLKAVVKILCRLITEKKIVKYSMKGLSKKLSNMSFDGVISYTNDIWENGWAMPGCNYLVSTIKTGQRVGWIHAELGYLGLTRERIISTYSEFDKIVCVSNSCKNELMDVCPEFKDRIYTCHNIVDKNRIDILKEEPLDEKLKRKSVFKIVTVARMELHSKRIDRIVHIANMLKSQQIPFVWYLVGGGMDYDKVCSMVEDAGLLDVILITGMVSNPYPFMRYSDLFVLTSDTESYGIVLKESILCGTPVITTDFGASSEVVEDNVNGYIVKKDNRVIFDKICLLFDDRIELERLTKNCVNSGNTRTDEFDIMIGA